LTHLALAQTTGPSRLQQISVEGSDTHTVVSLRLDGEGVGAGTLEEITTAPFRLFIDLPNVIPHVQPATRVESGGVDRVRVALNQSSPPVTRVVLDLNRRSPYRLERDPKSQTLRIVVGTPPLTESPDATGSARVDEEYASWFARSARQIDHLLSDAQGGDAAAWAAIWDEVEAATPPPSLQLAHDLLATAVRLGAVAVGEVSHSGERSPEAESASAGARLFTARAKALVLDASPLTAGVRSVH
jgi:hypothetical protein